METHSKQHFQLQEGLFFSTNLLPVIYPCICLEIYFPAYFYIYHFTLQHRHALLTARPWAERGSWFTRGFLTTRPWAERGSWFTRVFFFRLWCEQTQASTRPNFESHNL